MAFVVELNELHLSDVFFNLEHPNFTERYREAVHAEAELPDEEMRTAIRLDAVSFADMIERSHDTALIDWLADNFLGRL